MQFEWDPEKARRNLAKHGIAFDDATFVWGDPLYGLYQDRVVDGEARWHAIGMVGGALLVVVHCYPRGEESGQVRIIGARRATPHERKDYEEGTYS